MGRMGQESDYKTQLVLEVCSIPTRSVLCVHTLVSSPAKPPFIDWYCILGVEENAGVNTIRKQYHKRGRLNSFFTVLCIMCCLFLLLNKDSCFDAALQLHPDKNKHPKAKIAFNLLYEAYICLSDAAKRKAFDSERYKSFCFECNRIPYTSKKVPSNSTPSSLKTRNIISESRSYTVRRNIREMRERLKEEAKVIENCLRANSMSKKESPLYNPADYRHGSRFQNEVEREIPVFNPMKYLYQGYPHLRDHVCNNSETCWYFKTQNLVHSDKGEAKAKYASPVFEVRSQRSMLRSKFAYVPSRC
ncbi:hypothetical protein CR513_51916, partial [Mucuna pruriens]